jgi:hypothetical protein
MRSFFLAFFMDISCGYLFALLSFNEVGDTMLTSSNWQILYLTVEIWFVELVSGLIFAVGSFFFMRTCCAGSLWLCGCVPVIGSFSAW